MRTNFFRTMCLPHFRSSPGIFRSECRHIMLLEVLIAFVLIVFCALPLIYPHVFILKSEKEFVSTVELDHVVNLLYVEILQKMYQNEVPWSSIEGRKAMSIDVGLLKTIGYENKFPFVGTYRFKEIKHKTSTDKDHAVYLLKLIFTFTPKKGDNANATDNSTNYQYEYEVVIERKAA